MKKNLYNYNLYKVLQNKNKFYAKNICFHILEIQVISE